MDKGLLTIGIVTAVVIVGVIVLFSAQNLSGQVSPANAKVGDPAPEFALPSQLGGTVSLADFKGKKNVLLYFHEGITCDPCWEQIPELEKNLKDFEDMNVTLVSVTVDQVEDIKKRSEPYDIKTPVLYADAKEIDEKYGLARYSMAMNAPGGGIRPGHTFVLVDTNGVITWRKDYWDGYGMMNVPNGKMFVKAQEIIDEIKSAMRQ